MLMSRPTSRAHPRTGGFTLVEILIVVLLIAILASIVIPKVTHAAAEARNSSVQMSLHRMRIQLEIYREQHDGTYPTLANFKNQMTQATNSAGTWASPGTSGYPYGPYLRELPVNANTGGTTFGDGEVGSSDWYYSEVTGEFRANDSDEARVW